MVEMEDCDSVRLSVLDGASGRGFLCSNPRPLRHSWWLHLFGLYQKHWCATHHRGLSERRSVETHAVLYQACAFELVGIH